MIYTDPITGFVDVVPQVIRSRGLASLELERLALGRAYCRDTTQRRKERCMQLRLLQSTQFRF
jgi:hypothetical protein